MKVTLLGGPKDGKTVEHIYGEKLIVPIYEDIPFEQLIPPSYMVKVKHYIYSFSHRMFDGTVYFKCENPDK